MDVRFSLRGEANMKTIKIILAAMLILAGGMASVPALAAGGHGHGGFRGGHARFGVVIGAPLFWPGYYSPYYSPYYPPYYSYPSYYSDPGYAAAPAQYVEAPAAQPAPASQAYWYYCAGSKAYYPYVQQCPGGWQRVAPQPPPG
jgi:hypothetical protein